MRIQLTSLSVPLAALVVTLGCGSSGKKAVDAWVEVDARADGREVGSSADDANRDQLAMDTGLPDSANLGGDVSGAEVASDGEPLAATDGPAETDRHDAAPDVSVDASGDEDVRGKDGTRDVGQVSDARTEDARLDGTSNLDASGPTLSCPVLQGTDPVICDFENVAIDPDSGHYLFSGGAGLTGAMWTSAGISSAVGTLSLSSDSHGGASALAYNITAAGSIKRSGSLLVSFYSPGSGDHPCMNASSYAGIEFWAKGLAPAGVTLTLFQQTGVDGTILTFDYLFVPTETWTKYSVRWADFFGSAGDHPDPSAIHFFTFEVGSARVDTLLQIDDIVFTTYSGGPIGALQPGSVPNGPAEPIEPAMPMGRRLSST